MDDRVRGAEVPAPEVVDDPGDAAVGEVEAPPVTVIDQVAEEIGVRHPGAEPGLQPAPGQHVGQSEVLRQPERVLIADRDDRGAQLHSLGALPGRGEEHRGRPDTVLKVPLPDPGAVEAESFAVLEQPQRVLQAG